MEIDFMGNEILIERYNQTIQDATKKIPLNGSFSEYFSKASIESILLFIVATAIFALEKIFDLHKQEVAEAIENIIPHRPKWYRDMALKFMVDEVLIDETDRYDTSEMTEEEIEEKRIVKYATAVESNGNLLIKIATGKQGALRPIPNGEDNTPDYQTAFEAYMNEVRDAGVRISVINEPGDNFSCELTIFYDSILLASEVHRYVLEAIENYITGLPFNGEYSNMALVDAVQIAKGVKIVSFGEAKIENSEIQSKVVPKAGYFTFDKNTITLNLMPYAIQQ